MDSVLGWLKEFLIVYLILTVFTQLCASQQLKKYLRFFSGVILLLMLFSPIMRLLGRDASGAFFETSSFEEKVSYEAFLEQLDSIRQDSKKLAFLNNDNTMRKYEDAIARDILRQANGQQIFVSKVQVRLNGQYEIEGVSAWLSASATKEEKKEAKKELARLLRDTYGIEEERLNIS